MRFASLTYEVLSSWNRGWCAPRAAIAQPGSHRPWPTSSRLRLTENGLGGASRMGQGNAAAIDPERGRARVCRRHGLDAGRYLPNGAQVEGRDYDRKEGRREQVTSYGHRNEVTAPSEGVPITIGIGMLKQHGAPRTIPSAGNGTIALVRIRVEQSRPSSQVFPMFATISMAMRRAMSKL